MSKVLAQAIGVASTTPKMNMLECVEFEQTIGSVVLTNEYVYIRNTHGGAVAANLGVAWQGDQIGGISLTLGFTTGISMQFLGINTGALADDEYGWILTRGAIDLSLAAGALRVLTCTNAGVLAAAAAGAPADGDVGFVMDDGMAVIGYSTSVNTIT